MTDRRQRKSRAALQRALLALLSSTPYDAITVEAIAQAADVARGTFYAHYRDREELLLEATSELMGDLQARLEPITPTGPVFEGAGIREVFRHADEHRDLYLLLIAGQGGIAARNALVSGLRTAAADAFSRIAAAVGTKPRLPMPEISTAFVGALLLTLEAWLHGELSNRPDAVAERFIQGQADGLAWMLGAEPGSLVYRPATP